MVRKSILFVLICCILVSCSNSRLKYPTEKDTVDYFGDGTFQLLGGYDSSGKETLTLFDMSKPAVEDVVANNVVEYVKKKKFVYFFDDKKRYILLDVKTNDLSISTDLSSFSSDKQQIFKRLNK
ncbi:hypothetical protein [Cohnella luojiensis]|uniref:Lipoprotein n=1 Tax=Cohnella luojiensis TaxID=652876 RepID=A0A4Y8LTL8_9BACL|nr:hypothetical protein [Cohnella luojiensis]TFE19323.1 hypothetical protein E2980_23560 [Cohnella luojiensis]